jgi:hypothetical protein
MLAERLPNGAAEAEPDAALQVTSIHSIEGTLPPASLLVTEPPFCAPASHLDPGGDRGRRQRRPAPGSAGRADFSLLNRLAGAGMRTPPAERVSRREES